MRGLEFCPHNIEHDSAALENVLSPFVHFSQNLEKSEPKNDWFSQWEVEVSPDHTLCLLTIITQSSCSMESAVTA